MVLDQEQRCNGEKPARDHIAWVVNAQIAARQSDDEAEREHNQSLDW